jgi:hypothetical protein
MHRAAPPVLADADRIVRVTLRPPSTMFSTMSEIRSSHDVPAPGRTGRPRGACDGLLAGLMILTLVRTGEALAGEHLSIAGDALKPNLHPAPGPTSLSAAVVGIPTNLQALDLTADETFPGQSFRPRGRSILEKESPFGGPVETPLISNTTVWQRLSEYHTRDRLRVLTLWEIGGNSVSLQAGKKGDPSLQWTSRLMSHGRATHGILDELFAKSLGAVMGHRDHAASRSAMMEAPGKSERLLEGGAIP